MRVCGLFSFAFLKKTNEQKLLCWIHSGISCKKRGSKNSLSFCVGTVRARNPLPHPADVQGKEARKNSELSVLLQTPHYRLYPGCRPPCASSPYHIPSVKCRTDNRNRSCHTVLPTEIRTFLVASAFNKISSGSNHRCYTQKERQSVSVWNFSAQSFRLHSAVWFGPSLPEFRILPPGCNPISVGHSGSCFQDAFPGRGYRDFFLTLVGSFFISLTLLSKMPLCGLIGV